jgi:hypothetical protein
MRIIKVNWACTRLHTMVLLGMLRHYSIAKSIRRTKFWYRSTVQKPHQALNLLRLKRISKSFRTAAITFMVLKQLIETNQIQRLLASLCTKRKEACFTSIVETVLLWLKNKTFIQICQALYTRSILRSLTIWMRKIRPLYMNLWWKLFKGLNQYQIRVSPRI